MIKTSDLPRLLTPLFVAGLLAAMATVVMFFVAAAGVSGDDQAAVGLGPMTFVQVTHERIDGGSTVSAEPGAGLALLWVLLLGYGAAVGWLRYRSRRARS